MNWTLLSNSRLLERSRQLGLGKNMQHIDEPRLEEDLGYRFNYLVEFVGLTANDILAIHNSATLLAPLVPQLVDAVYEKLFTYDATKRHFLPRQSGFEGEAALTVNHEIIKFRKEHLSRYLKALVTRPYDGKMVEYLNMVGKIHTAKAGSSELIVPLVQMNALMGFVSDALINTIFAMDISNENRIATVRAFNKLLWLQNDLITRHYQN
jgi:hypothetical protein